MKVGKLFFKSVNKHFTQTEMLHKFLNKNYFKVSYCCTNNMQKMIFKHNINIFNEQTGSLSIICNCKDPERSLLESNCQAKNVIYQAVVTNDKNWEMLMKCNMVLEIIKMHE